MEKEFIPYELAITLNEIGFDEPCFGYYLTNLLTNKVKLFIDDRKGFSSFEKTTPAPIFSQVFRFFRDTYNISGEIGINVMEDDEYCYEVGDVKTRTCIDEDSFSTHKQAELQCLKKLIEIVKNK